MAYKLLQKKWLDDNNNTIWSFTSKKHKNNILLKNRINNVQIGDLLFTYQNQKIESYGRCIMNSKNGKDIQVDSWTKFEYPLEVKPKPGITSITDLNLLTKIHKLHKVYKLKRIKINNFRLFETLEINFNNDVNVIIANNGSGKTTILDAIAIAFGSMLTKFPTIQGINFEKKDLRLDKNNKYEPYMRIILESTENTLWDRIKKRDSTKKTASDIPKAYGLKELYTFVDNIVDAENNNLKYNMPLVIYYKTNRAVFDAPLRKRNFKKSFNRFESLHRALVNDASFHRLFQWFDAMEDLERRERDTRKSYSYVLPELQNVRDAIESMLPSFKNPRIEVRPLRFVIDWHKDDSTIQKLQIEQLSDGYRTVLAMVMDISARMSEANPHLGNKSEAIILIDELELHLHPKWQQTILSDLRRTFPNAQFIVTTHSPHILSSIVKEKLFILQNAEIKEISFNTYGKPANELLLNSFNLNYLRYPEIDKKIEFLQDLLHKKDNIEETYNLKIQELENDIGKDDIDILKLKLEKLKRDKDAKN